jgi:hypothetical protein
MTDSVVARTVKGFCEAYGVGKTTAYELIAGGELEIRKAGSRTLVIEESAQRWFAKLPYLRPCPQVEMRASANAGEQGRKRQYHKSRVQKGKAANV